MIIEGVDPRDIDWEVDQPAYRVYFWRLSHAPPEVPEEHIGYRSDEYRIRDASDVHEVLDWARTKAMPEQTFTLYVELIDQRGQAGLVHLAGIDPTVSN